MTKAPRAGQVKTRLVPPLTPDEAAQLNSCFLRDTTAAISAAAGSVACGIAVYTPVGAESDYDDMLPPDFALLPQRGDHFGARLINAAEDLFRIGFSSVCLIDSDSPMVPVEVYAEAPKLLSTDEPRILLGPSDDGGYYLIGLQRLCRRVFENIDWSTERVLQQTIARARELQVRVELLPIGYDVDDGATLRRLCQELLDTRATSTNDVAPATREFLSEIVAREGRSRICA
ncbi:MAG TPA: TIGR04282 family arsenosugar biosynthesis glycosyltransferase [Chthoniobacterales bacterium]|nr:TIGR04282 family arsenosugar biosynthesis glycosyltransferase [Chthoniobacterales bacterium]